MKFEECHTIDGISLTYTYMEFGSLSKLMLEKFHTMDGISLTYLLKE